MCLRDCLTQGLGIIHIRGVQQIPLSSNTWAERSRGPQQVEGNRLTFQ